jgi:hypothetical protein
MLACLFADLRLFLCYGGISMFIGGRCGLIFRELLFVIMFNVCFFHTIFSILRPIHRRYVPFGLLTRSVVAGRLSSFARHDVSGPTFFIEAI